MRFSYYFCFLLQIHDNNISTLPNAVGDLVCMQRLNLRSV